MLLFSNFEEQKESKSMETPVSTIALQTEHLIKRDDIIITPITLAFQCIKVF
jgi:hypothetical protein